MYEEVDVIEYKIDDETHKLVLSLQDADFGTGTKRWYEISYLTPASEPNSWYSNNSEHYLAETKFEEALRAFEYRRTHEPAQKSPECNFINRSMFV